jgi:hypothetical protein
MRAIVDFVAGLLLRRIVGPPAAERERSARSARSARARARPQRRRRAPARARRREQLPRPAPGQRPPVPPGRPRGPLVALTLGAFAVGAPLMLLFEAWYTRVVGVLALFTFVVAGVFVIAGSAILDPEEDE